MILEKGKLLIITGAIGTGKSILASLIASQYGNHETVSLIQLIHSNFFPVDILTDDIKTIIIEDESDGLSHIYLNDLRKLVTNDTMVFNQQYKTPETINTPNFILCTGAVNPVKFDESDRRFKIISIK